MTTLTFDTFWSWLQGHSNCILRVATRDSIVYDDDDLHWWVGLENGVHLVQVIYGKRLRGEIIVDPDRVSYVQALGQQGEDEFIFELINENSGEQTTAFVFSMGHDLDDGESTVHGHAVH